MAKGSDATDLNSTRAGRAIERLDDRKLAGIAPIETNPSDFGNKQPDYRDEIAEDREIRKIQDRRP